MRREPFLKRLLQADAAIVGLDKKSVPFQVPDLMEHFLGGMRKTELNEE